MAGIVNRVVACCAVAFCLAPGLARAGDCLDSREKMVVDLKAGIEYSIANPEAKEVDLGPWIGHCWYYSPYKDDESFDDELAQVVLWALHHPGVPAATRQRVLAIARSAAPRAIFSDLLAMLEERKIEETETAAVAVLFIWGRYARRDSAVAKFDCYEFVKHYMPSVFDSATDRPIHEREALSTLHYVLSLAYPGDYPAVRELLIQWGLLGRPSMCIRFFNDPRAWEDAGALDCEDDCMCRYNNFFYSMAGHLELEFKEKWIRKLEPHQPALLRNGIMATYGRRFTKPRLRSFFATEVSKFCRDGKCGVVSKAYDDSLLTAVDRANIALIQKIERETH